MLDKTLILDGEHVTQVFRFSRWDRDGVAFGIHAVGTIGARVIFALNDGAVLEFFEGPFVSVRGWLGIIGDGAREEVAGVVFFAALAAGDS